MKNNLFTTFTGDLVSITLKVYLMESKDTEQETYSFQVPMTKQGYLIEEDRYSYYFGPDPDNVTFAVKKRDISVMELATEDNGFLDILNNMGSKKEEMN